MYVASAVLCKSNRVVRRRHTLYASNSVVCDTYTTTHTQSTPNSDMFIDFMTAEQCTVAYL